MGHTSDNTRSRSPWRVSLWGSATSESWERESVEKAISDATTFVQVAESRGEPLLVTVRDRRGVLVHRLATADYVPLEVLPVAS